MTTEQARGSLNALPPGTVLRDYVIESELGSGGFSIVYLARHHLKSEWLYAIKEFLPAELAVRAHGSAGVSALNTEARGAFEDGLRRFRDEAEQLRKFRNERYVVSCLNYFEENGTAYLVMDYDDGLPLSEFLEHREAAGQPFTETDLRAVVEPLLEGLEVVHRAGVLHRDIKPGNIFVRRQDEITGRPAHPVLIDFGAAKQNYLARHSRSQAPYTPGYAAYEQVSSMGEVGPWTDMYALGALMWRMVAGGSLGDPRLRVSDDADADKIWSPTPRASEMRSYALHRGRPDPMVRAAELGSGRYSPHLLEAIDRCLTLYPEDRVQDCGELRNLLEARPGVTLDESETGSMSPIGASEDGVANLPTSRPGESTASGSIVAAPASSHGIRRQEPRRPFARVRSPAALRVLWVGTILVVFALSAIIFQRYRWLAEQGQTVAPVSANVNNDNPAVGAGNVRSQADCALWGTDPGSFFSLAHTQDVNRCLMTGADIRARYESGATALHIAAEFSAIPEVINTLVGAGASVNARDGDGGTALHAAAGGTDNPEVLSALVNVGASVNLRDEIGATPLHVAARDNDDPEVIRALVNLDADVNAPAHSGTTSQRWVAGTTPLHVAAGYNDNPEVIHALVNLGADISAQTDSRYTPLHFAASSNDNPEVIDALLNAGAIVNARDNFGDTPLHEAARSSGNPDVVDTLLNAGADINARDNSGETALHRAARSNDNPDTIATLLIAGADIDARDDSGKSPLHAAAWLNDNPAVIETMINAGADINASDNGGYTPLHVAAGSSDNPEVIDALLNAGADVNARGRTSEDTPLHAAARSNDNPEMIDALLNAGADINARDDLGRTVLHQAARYSDNPEVIDALLNAGADINAQDDFGETVIDEARWNRNSVMREAVMNARAED